MGRLNVFANRKEAAQRLAAALTQFRRKPNTIVIGLPRGGVVSAAEVADALELPLDTLVIRKLGTPGEEELAMGAVGPGAARVLNFDVIEALGITPVAIEEETRRELIEIDRRERLFRGGRPRLDVGGRTVILVDDGIATGATMEAALAVLRRQGAVRVVVAVPVGSPEACMRLRETADDMICLEMPDRFMAVGRWYEDFDQVEDAEVKTILEHHTGVAAAVP
jgi:putative phosphoribosyl transferase